MDRPELVSRQLALLAGIIAAETARFALDKIEDAGLRVLTGSGPFGLVPRPPTLVAAAAFALQRAALTAPPLTGRLTAGVTYAGLRAGIAAAGLLGRAVRRSLGV